MVALYWKYPIMVCSSWQRHQIWLKSTPIITVRDSIICVAKWNFWCNFFFAELLWVAPELLAHTTFIGCPRTQKGDVYSFAIILEEIVVRGGPYESARQLTDVPSIVKRISAQETPPFRPCLAGHDCPPDLMELMEKCWSENPEDRPSFSSIRSTIRDIMK